MAVVLNFDLEWYLQDLLVWEGFRSHPYLDSKNIWTIGIGDTNWEGETVTEHTVPVTKEEALDNLREKDAPVSIKDAEIWAGDWWKELSGPRQAVLSNMHFQMGATRLRKFIQTQKYVKKGEHSNAAAEMLRGSSSGTTSQWYKDSERRAKTMAFRMEFNHYDMIPSYLTR